MARWGCSEQLRLISALRFYPKPVCCWSDCSAFKPAHSWLCYLSGHSLTDISCYSKIALLQQVAFLFLLLPLAIFPMTPHSLLIPKWLFCLHNCVCGCTPNWELTWLKTSRALSLTETTWVNALLLHFLLKAHLRSYFNIFQGQLSGSSEMLNIIFYLWLSHLTAH